ncbi:MAG: biotin/lipoyl-binding protein [Acidobacteria bacterium]|nr:biotin/lipoyl-binding protein [Acidobacteriota bacterium]
MRPARASALQVLVGARELRLSLEREPGLCRFRIDAGPERTALVAQAQPQVYSVLLDGRSYEVRLEGSGDRRIVIVEGYRFEVELRDPRRWRPGSTSQAGEGLHTVAAAMPGKVVRLLVAAGDRVEAGQGIVVVEAMKMQNEMKAPRAGRVAALPVAEGSAVAAGEILATIE